MKNKNISLLISFIILLILFLIKQRETDVISILFYLNIFLASFFYFSLTSFKICTSRIVHNFFIFLFFTIAPFLQREFDLWFIEITDNQILKLNIILLVYILIYNISLYFFKEKKYNYFSSEFYLKPRFIRLKFYLLISFILIGYFILDNPSNFLLNTSAVSGDFGPKRLIFQFFVQPLFFLPLLLIFSQLKIHIQKGKSFFILFLFLSSIIWNFPTASARFYIFTLYFALLLVYLFNSKNKNINSSFFIYFLLPIFFLGSLFVPLITEVFLPSNNFNDFLISYVTGGNFDAYENVSHIIDYTDKSGFSSKQITGALYFFLPRQFYPEKVVGTGAYVMYTYFNSPVTNVSAPLLAEIYLFGGLLGVVLLPLLLSYFHFRLDSFYNKTFQIKNYFQVDYKKNIFLVYYSLFIPFNLIILRGDFLTAFSSWIGFTFSFFFSINYLFKKVINNDKTP